MPTVLQEQINAALYARVTGIGSSIYPARNLDAPAQRFPAVIYRDGEVTDTQGSPSHVESEMHPTLELVVAPDSAGSDLDAKMATLYATVFAAVLVPDPTLGGIATNVRQLKITPDVLSGMYEGAVKGWEIELEVLFQWLEGRPDVAA